MMYLIIDKRNEERPKVYVSFEKKADAIDAFLNLSSSGNMFEGEQDTNITKRCYKILKENKYVTNGEYCLQEF